MSRLLIPKDATILVVCGGEGDRAVFQELGYTNVTISNLQEQVGSGQFHPYNWALQDAEKLTYPDESFDYVVVNAGLHHCASPHRALLEMYRTARSGILVVESRDNLLVRLAQRLGFSWEYELPGVFCDSSHLGGVRASSVPNYIYRWNEREVMKTVQSYAPFAHHRIDFYYGLRLPYWLLDRCGSSGHRVAASLASPFVKALVRVFPRQGNLFAFFIHKPIVTDLHPWMKTPSELDFAYAKSPRPVTRG